MKNLTVKFSTVNNEVETASSTRNHGSPVKKRIDEEGLFGLFTANIIKLKTRFTR